MSRTLLAAAIAASLVAGAAAAPTPAPPAAASTAGAEPNPVLAESTLPFHYPRFDRFRDDDFLPALRFAMADKRENVTAIAANPATPTFDNTIVALERAGRTLARVERIFSNLQSCNTDATLDATRKTTAPELAATNDAMLLDARLFARVDALWNQRDTLGLDAESARLLWRWHEDFVRAGARLPESKKAQLRALNQQLASLTATFQQNVLKERGASAVTFDRREDLDGLGDAEIDAAAAAAKAAGDAGKFRIELVNTTGQPPLTTLRRHSSRERIMAASLARGSRGGPFDNRAVVADIARLRAERAALLGYRSHADFALADQTVGSVATLDAFLAQLAPAAVASAKAEATQLQAMVDADGEHFALGAADWAYYAEKLRAKSYAFDESQLKPYYEMDHVLVDGVFWAATQLYGITFKERHDLPVYEPSVRVFDVFDKDGSPLAIFIADWYARPNKNGGAWMNAYVAQDGLTGDRPVVANHLNIPKPPAGQPTLLTQDEVVTAFHEFGHALHGMFSNVRYPHFSSPSVPRDFVEYPSQFNEMWATYPAVLQHFARDYRTGAPIPQALVDKMQAARHFDAGFAATEYLSATLLDQAWHTLGVADVPDAAHVMFFENHALHRAGVDFAPVPTRYRSPYFSHVFAGGYAAGYYGYIWSEVLAADSTDWMLAHGGLKRENGDRVRVLLSKGGSVDAMQLFRDLTGSAPTIGPLLERRGLAPAPAASTAAAASASRP